MANHQDDLDLLLSLQDRVLETPPASPSALHSPSPGYLSDDGSPKRTGQVDMSDFRDAVQDCLDYGPENAKQALKSNQIIKSNDPLVEKFSGLRIRNQLVSSAELTNRFSDIRFVRLQAIKNVLMGDTLSGCWATVGVLVEKGIPKVSSTGKNYCIWKIGCLDEKTISVFLFGDAYQRYSTEMAGTVLALFNCAVRKDNLGAGFSLSVYSATHVLKIGTSADYGVCKGKRKDGMACTLVINKRHGIYCSYHRSKASQKYSVTRTELKGGNLKTAFRNPLKSEGIYLVDPLADRTNVRKPMQPVKLLSVDALKRALSNAGKVTTNIHSQGIRFLTEVTGKLVPKSTDGAYVLPNLQSSTKRSLSSTRCDTSAVRSPQTNAKRTKLEDGLPKKAESIF
ncbi:uncharacterized protein LOC127801235 isoform X2 [Diospyros lotus]|uniref:uncharacterized protein LOC127801235 isoform X2 n=1 Tax=Diospyros lotus TaxID=55363 RepID=UPI0022556928|nr:uncharacterized protein LOC127801235 isoform X2 [Diospyros lotus]